MSPALLFASLFALLPGGVVLFRILSHSLSNGFPLWSIRLFGLLSLFLVVLSSFAGSSYKGVCYSTELDASRAVALDVSLPVPFFSAAASGTSGAMSYSIGSVSLSCSPGTQFGAPILTCLRAVVGRFGQPSVSSGVATSYSISGSTVQFLSFPPCDVPSAPTSEDTLYVFSWGFGVIILFWSLGLAVGVSRRLINKV